ncbi:MULTISPECIES: hypothetical protein [unclassified Hyphomicrobium]|uniref:hypothetical protein n=1 Tax=unclassified Hyphomicrobium TaxID=2619925 RepID=UPI000213DF75|nr:MULTISPECIES: hypothetical protein [unclassified Hyphomicrobium]CCB65186.1 conserved protein of unknown function [Hyphomicrobium sp. MC1]
MAVSADLKRAVDLAIAGDWDGAHQIAQRDERDPMHRWLHAILHKIEGDGFNSRYWYRGSGHAYEDFPSPEAELQAIAEALE